MMYISVVYVSFAALIYMFFVSKPSDVGLAVQEKPGEHIEMTDWDENEEEQVVDEIERITFWEALHA